MSIRFYFTLLLIAVYTGKSISQVVKQDFSAINKAYTDLPQFSMKVKYEMYKNKSIKTVFQTELGEVKQKEHCNYSRVGKVETLSNETYKLIVDHEDKSISLLPVVSEDNSTITEAMYMGNLEQMLSLCERTEFKKETATQNSYTLIIPNDQYTAVQLFYNSKTFFVEKMILFYKQEMNLEEKEGGLKESPRMEITYYDMNVKPTFGKDTFTYDKFLEKRNGKFLATAAYKGYDITEQLSVK
jgi:hypothetical protein